MRFSFIRLPTLALALAMSLAGCALFENYKTSARIRDIESSVSRIRSVILEIVPLGHRAISPNGREILSKHFNLDLKGGYKPAGDAPLRYFAQFLILNDRRPYTVEILVTQEQRVVKNGHRTYVVKGYSERLAKDLESKLRDELSKRPEDTNIIDDFRVY